MYREKSICVVVPAYNEEKLIGQTLGSIPASRIAALIHLRAPSPSAGGKVMWYASPLIPKPVTSA